MRPSSLAIALGSMLLVLPSAVYANDFKVPFGQGDLSVGPSAAIVGSDGFALNLDASLAFINLAGSLNGKLVQRNGQTLYGAQVEATVWLVANLGGGVGYLAGSEYGPVVDLFVGLPIPGSVSNLDPFKASFVEPYYRYNLMYSDARWAPFHEVGVFIKITTLD